MQWLKGISSRILLSEFAYLRKQFWRRHLWARGYLSVSSGNVTDEMIQQYIEGQEGEPIVDDSLFKIDCFWTPRLPDEGRSVKRNPFKWDSIGKNIYVKNEVTTPFFSLGQLLSRFSILFPPQLFRSFWISTLDSARRERNMVKLRWREEHCKADHLRGLFSFTGVTEIFCLG